MKQMYTNATVRWTEVEIERREALIREIPALLSTVWRTLNTNIRPERVETPILTPSEKIQSHIKTGFDLMATNKPNIYLRPETTAGTYEAFKQDWPHKNQWSKILPLCYWQAGKSFRDEANGETMRATKLRLREFWQMEFQIFCLPNTKADYIGTALSTLCKRYGGNPKTAEELPHYSKSTTDWMIKELEVAGCSIRTDFENLEVHEIAIGLDRLTALTI